MIMPVKIMLLLLKGKRMHMGRTIVYDAVLAASSGGSDANSTKPQKKKMRKSRDQRVSLS